MENLIYSKKKAWFEDELSNVQENDINIVVNKSYVCSTPEGGGTDD